MRRRRLIIPLVIALLAGMGTIVLKGASTGRAGWESLEIPAWEPVVDVPPGTTACQGPVFAEKAFSWLAFTPDLPEADAVARRPRPAVRVQVLVRSSSRRLADVVLPADRTPGGPRRVALGRVVPAGEPLLICFTNAGRAGLVLWGRTSPLEAEDDPYVAGALLTQSELRRGAARVPGDLFLELGAGPRRTPSLLTKVPDAFARASRFKVPFFGAWTFWVLLAVFTLAVPVLLVRALVGAADTDLSPEPRS